MVSRGRNKVGRGRNKIGRGRNKVSRGRKYPLVPTPLKGLQIFFLKMLISFQQVLWFWFYWRSCPGVVPTHHLSPTSMGLYVSNLVDGVLNIVELELIYNFFISCSIAQISQVEVYWTSAQSGIKNIQVTSKI